MLAALFVSLQLILAPTANEFSLKALDFYMFLKNEPLPPSAYRIVKLGKAGSYLYQSIDGFFLVQDVTREVQSLEGRGGTDWAHRVEVCEEARVLELLSEPMIEVVEIFGVEIRPSDRSPKIIASLKIGGLNFLIHPQNEISEVDPMSRIYLRPHKKEFMSPLEVGGVMVPFAFTLGQVAVLPAYLASKLLDSWDDQNNMRALTFGTLMLGALWQTFRVKSAAKKYGIESFRVLPDGSEGADTQAFTFHLLGKVIVRTYVVTGCALALAKVAGY